MNSESTSKIRKLIIEGREMVIPPADKWNIPTHGRIAVGRELETPYRTLIDPTLFAIMAAVQDPLAITIDVGANIGALARYLALRSQSEYIAIEAGAINFACLLKNTEDIPRIRAVHAAVTSEASVEFVNRGTVCDHVVTPSTKFNTPKITVPGLALDSLSLESRVGLLKIDVEGYTYHALASGKKLIRENRPIVFIEAVESAMTRYGTSVRDVFRFFKELSYRSPVDKFGDVVHLGDFTADLIFLPPEGVFIPRFGFSYRHSRRDNPSAEPYPREMDLFSNPEHALDAPA